MVQPRTDGRSFRIVPEAQALIDKVMTESGMSFSAAVNNAITTLYGGSHLTYYRTIPDDSAAAVCYTATRLVEETHTSVPTWPPPRRRSAKGER